MKAVESPPPYIHFVLLPALHTREKGKQDQNKKPPHLSHGIWAPSENLNTFELCISVKYVV